MNDLAGELVAHLLAVERRLADAGPADSGLADLLAEDFVEFGASGRRWTRNAVIAEFRVREKRHVEIADFSMEMLGPDVALVTYRSTAEASVAVRSSIWVLRNGRWQMRFHQGTPVVAPGDLANG
jgi:hypothetical protein